MLNAGSVPLSASAKNWSVLCTWRMYWPIPTGKTSAVNCKSFCTLVTAGKARLAASSRRRAIRRLCRT